MNNSEIKNEIELRLSPSDLSISSRDLIDIMNEFNVNEEYVTSIYYEIIREKESEITQDVEDTIDYFREKGNYYPSFQEFKQVYDDNFENPYINNNILRSMYKKAITDENQISLFEMVFNKKENKILESFNDDYYLDDESDSPEDVIKNWGGEIKKDRSAKLNPEDIFDMIDAGAVAKADIQGEFGDDEFMSMTDDEYKSIMNNVDEAIDNKGLFQIEDAEGNILKKLKRVKPIDGVNKTGIVTGFGDDGNGNTQVIVSWEWPIDMKFTNPEEMGKSRVYPQDIVLADSKNKTEEPIEEMRGLGKGVKNSGDRNVKLRDDHHSAPITDLNESIKKFFEGRVTKGQLKNFISEQAKKIAKNK